MAMTLLFHISLFIISKELSISLPLLIWEMARHIFYLIFLSLSHHTRHLYYIPYKHVTHLLYFHQSKRWWNHIRKIFRVVMWLKDASRLKNGRKVNKDESWKWNSILKWFLCRSCYFIRTHTHKKDITTL